MEIDQNLKQIAVWVDTVQQLDELKLCDDETYNSVIRRMIGKVDALAEEQSLWKEKENIGRIQK